MGFHGIMVPSRRISIPDVTSSLLASITRRSPTIPDMAGNHRHDNGCVRDEWGLALSPLYLYSPREDGLDNAQERVLDRNSVAAG